MNSAGACRAELEKRILRLYKGGMGILKIGRTPEIWIRPVRSPRAYAVALHEIGHIGRHQRSQAVLVRERWAWHWAKRNALDWTPAMQRHADWCLESYKRDDSNNTRN